MSDLAILTKKKIVTFSEEDGETRSITLYPFGFKYFNAAIAIVNKYWNCYAAVKDEFKQEQKLIIHSNDSEEDKLKQLKFLDETFDEVGMVVKNIMTTDDSNLGSDIASMISFCCRKELDLDEFHWGEVGALLAAAIEVNMDFFAQNQSKITLLKVKEDRANLPQRVEKPVTDGESVSAA